MTQRLKVLVTCPPMLRMMEELLLFLREQDLDVTTPEVVQTLTESELKKLVPLHDGWIIGDDPATEDVFRAGKAGRLRAAVKWGVGIDNVDFAACKKLGIPVANTPGMFGAEVADVALGYVIALARETFYIDRGVRAGSWPKPRGISLAGKTCALLGYGDIGRNFAARAVACGMRVLVYDPGVTQADLPELMELRTWPSGLEAADIVVVTCALTPSSRRIVNQSSMSAMKRGVRIVNVSRGPIVDEVALIDALRDGHVHSAALDVFEFEPLPLDSSLRQFENCIFGSHNASNTADAVLKTSKIAVAKLLEFLQ